MPSSIVRLACLVPALLAGAATACAGDLADFNAGVEAAAAHNRVAIDYLRTGNTDLASIELDRLRESWGALARHFAGKRPEAFDGNAYYVVAMTDISTRLITADLMLQSNHAAVARQALLAVRNDLYKLRKSAGIAVLADCVYDANTAMDGLMSRDGTDPDLSSPDTAFDITGKASVYGYVLDRCDDMADASVRKAPDFRRLIDGAKAGLAQIPSAVATHDTERLHRILIELRSFDTLLAFRYG